MVTVIKIERIKLGLPQWEMAARLKVRDCYLSLMEAGRYKASVKIQKKIVKILGGSVEEMFLNDFAMEVKK